MGIAVQSPIPNKKMPEAKSFNEARTTLVDARGALQPVPLFSRLRFKAGVMLSMLALLAMTSVSILQIREMMREIRNDAVDKGCAVVAAVAPLVLAAIRHGQPEALLPYFRTLEETKDISYIQLVDGRGRVLVGNEALPGQQPPRRLRPDWLSQLKDVVKLDREAAAVPWGEDSSGVDVFLALAEQPACATPEEIENATHLRLGINFNAVLQKNIPRVMSRMVLLSVIATAAAVLLLLGWLAYVLRPVRELHMGLRAVAAGDLAYQVPVYTHDEMGRLAQVFNATVAQLRSAFQRIEELATHDALTKMANRRRFDDGLAAEAARSRRYGHRFGLIVMDLDKFKEINDRHGHPAGDEVLKAVARIIEANVRETDLAARIGGEEFAVLLPETNFKEVQAVAEKLRQAVADAELQAKQGLPPGVHITISAGAACSGGSLITPETIMAAADAALYQAKSRGRNLVCLAPQQAGKSDFLEGVKDEPEKGGSPEYTI